MQLQQSLQALELLDNLYIITGVTMLDENVERVHVAAQYCTAAMIDGMHDGLH